MSPPASVPKVRTRANHDEIDELFLEGGLLGGAYGFSQRRLGYSRPAAGRDVQAIRR
jgi:hypothetical protein